MVPGSSFTHSGRILRNLFLVSAVVIASLSFVSCEKAVDPASLRGGETRDTLSPAYFTGKASRSYKIAKEIPEIIDSIYCYCDCKKHHGHKSLLTCHVDTHSRYCGVCMDETIMAYELHKQGKDVVAIRNAIDKKFSNRRR